jgi:hypothetical protein
MQMKTGRTWVVRAAAAAIFASGAAAAQPAAPEAPPADAHRHGPAGHEGTMRHGMGPGGMGMGMGTGMGMGRGPVGMLTRRDADSATDMAIVMNLVHEHSRIRRTVTRMPDGIRTVTESDDPRIAREIKVHVASMSGRLESGKEFNIFSITLPVIFDNAKSIKSAIEYTGAGAIVTRTATDPKVVAALHAHADDVSELVKEGPVAFHRGIDARMAMGPGGPRGMRADTSGPAVPGRDSRAQ